MIETAIALFGRTGYLGTSTREIAASAGVNPPALQYYFHSKEGLYYACVDHVTRTILERLTPVLDQARNTLETAPTRDALIAAIHILQDCLVDAFYAEAEGPQVRRLLDSEYDIPETREARNLMRDRVNLPIFRVVSAIIGHLIGRPAQDRHTGLHAFAVFGGVMAFQLDQTRLFDAIGWRNPDPDAIAELKGILRTQTALALHGISRVP